jgi:Tetratricopeptide repeat
MFRVLPKFVMGSMLLLIETTLAGGSSTAVLAATPSELLEKAIYTEETVGDLDAAIEIYAQVIKEKRKAHSAAAQAQYRLARCLIKQGKEEKAAAAFRELIEQYPDEKELVAKALKHIPSNMELLPVPWGEGERMQFNMKLPTGLDIGTMFYMIEAADVNGEDVWRCSSRSLITISDVSSYSEVICEKESFAPIRSVWMHSLLGKAKAVYKQSEVVIDVAGKEAPLIIQFAPPVFDNEQGVQLFRRLPLKVGYEESVPIVTILGGNKIEIPASVTAIEKITVPVGTFECFKLELGLVGQTFWVSNDEHRYVVRFAAGGVTAELAEVGTPKPGEPSQLDGENFSLTLPPRWLSYQPSTEPKKDDGSQIRLLDPEAQAEAQVAVRPLSTLTEEQRESPEAWTESVIDKFKNRAADFKLRDPGMRDVTVGGMPATAVVADFTDSDSKKSTMYGIAVIGKNLAATLRFTANSDEFEELKKDFDRIVESFRLE